MRRNILQNLKFWQGEKSRQPLILRGARQIGKSYILHEFGKTCFSQYHYLNFENNKKAYSIFEEDLKPVEIIQKLEFHFQKDIDIENDLLVFDEIQDCPRALTSLKYFCEDMPELAVCAAGSLLGMHLSQVSFPVGKVQFLNMYPMSFMEFLDGIGDARSYDFLKNVKADEAKIPSVIHQHLWEQLKKYFIVGGLPAVVNVYREQQDKLFSALQDVRKKQDSLLDTYYADIAKHSGKENSMHIERVLKNVPAQLAKEESSSRFKFKDVVPGVDRYAGLVGCIDWLQKAGLIIRVPIANSAKLPLSAYLKESIFKLFIFDVGILGALSNLSPEAILDYDYGTYKGYFAENFVAQEFAFAQARADRIYAWKEGRSELEFLREIGSKVYPIEVKAGSNTRARSLQIFAERYKPEYRTIMSAKNLNIDDTNKVHNYPLYLAAQFPLTG